MKYKEYRLSCDFDRRRYDEKDGHLSMYLKNKSYKLSVNYRRCKYLETKKFLKLLWTLQRYKYNKLCIKYGCDIPSSAMIGDGFKINHTVGIVINSKTKIGKNFSIKGGTVIGNTEKGTPVIGDNVSVGANATIIGNITIADGCKIGAGAIVTKSLPEGSIAICDAAHILER